MHCSKWHRNAITLSASCWRCNGTRRAFFGWHCRDNLFEHRVRLAGNDDQPVSAGVNEMHFHCKLFVGCTPRMEPS